MRDFEEIHAIAAKRKGGEEALEKLLDKPLPQAKLARLPAAAWLEAMSKALFQAGFNWRVIEAKWSGFQTAFDQFDPEGVSGYDESDIEALLRNPEVVRNHSKIVAVIENARLLRALDEETGNASRHLASWPIDDQAGLLDLLARRGSRLGGITAQRVCRMVGRDSYVMSPDVCRRLITERIIAKLPTSRSAMAVVQDAFNIWRAESGRSLTEISQVLAMSMP